MRPPVVLAALGTVFGLQALRAFFPLLVYVVRDRFGLPSTALGGISLGMFLVAFAMPWAVRKLGPGRALVLTALALALARGLLQLWTGEPLVSLGLAAVASLGFVALLAALSGGPQEASRPVLVGALADAAIHATAGTRDLHWGGTFSDLAAWLLIGPALILALWSLRSERSDDGAPLSHGLGLLAWGPFLFLHLEWFGNVARLSSRTFLPTGTSGALVVLGLAAGILLARHLPTRGFWAGAPAILLAATFFGRGLVWSGVSGALAYPTLLVTQLAGATLLARALAAPRLVPRGLLDSLAFGGGFALFLCMIFAHYAGYDLPLPFSRTLLFLVAAAVLLVASIAVGPSSDRPVSRTPQRFALLLILPALLPLARPGLVQMFGKGAEPLPGQSGYRAPVRVVSFNLHNGFDERGDFALDEMLGNLRETNADVVALQEVSRGWVINGSADLFELTREAMGMPGVPAPSVQTDWGNAVFTRWEPDSAELVDLPPRDLDLPRSAVMVNLHGDGPEAPKLRIVATHFHHRPEDPEVREEHARYLADTLTVKIGTDPALLLGDFNALPDSRSLEILAHAGWHDAFDRDDAVSLTFPSRDPIRRIDTIFYRGPLVLEESLVAKAWGSDHRGVVAEVFPDGALTVAR